LRNEIKKQDGQSGIQKSVLCDGQAIWFQNCIRVLLKRDMGDVYNRPPNSYLPIFDLEEELTDESRLVLLDACFNDFIIPYSEKNLSVSGIRECAASGELLLLPAVRDEIDRLYPVCNQEYKNRL
jgi:hypothetical protein